MTATAKSSRFAKGSGVFACRVCGRQTRSTGRGDNELVGLCSECFDLGGEDNHLSDNGTLYSSPSEILNTIASVASKGGDASNWDDLKAAAEKALSDSQPNPEPSPTDYPFYLVTITGPEGFEEVILPVDAVKSSQARRMAKQELKAEGLSIEGLTFSARKA